MDDRRRRVAQFAERMHLGISPTRLRQDISGRPANFRTTGDEETAQTTPAEAKAAKIAARWWLRRKLTSKAKETTYDRKDVSTQLLPAVKSGDNPGLVELLRDMLLEWQGDINYFRRRSRSWMKWIRDIDQTDQRSNLLVLATASGNVDLVQLLVHHSHQTSLDESLNIALQGPTHARDLLIPELLPSHGADASRQNEASRSATESHNTPMMSLLLDAPNPISHECVSESLFPAVQLGSLDALFLLILASADGNGADGNGTAVKAAVRTGRQDLLNALLLCNEAPTPHILDEGVGVAFSEWANNPLQQGTLMEILLSNGARGPCSDSALLIITTKCITEPSSTANSSLKSMMALLVGHGASINHDNAAALKLCLEY